MLLWAVCILILLVLLGFAAAAALSSLSYWKSVGRDPSKDIPAPERTAKSILLVFLSSMVGYMAAVSLAPLGYIWGPRPKPLQPLRDLPLPPVILVHGLYDTAGSMFPLSRRLRAHGFTVFTFSYGSLTRTMDEVQFLFDDFVFQTENACPGRKPIAIGHSLGGLIIRRWMGKDGNTDRLSGVVTLGTPHHGSILAGRAPGKMARFIEPASGLLQEMSSHQYPAGRYVSLVSPTDEAVLPQSSLIPPEGWRMRLTPPVSHFGLLLCKRVFKQILDEISYMDVSLIFHREHYQDKPKPLYR